MTATRRLAAILASDVAASLPLMRRTPKLQVGAYWPCSYLHTRPSRPPPCAPEAG